MKLPYTYINAKAAANPLTLTIPNTATGTVYTVNSPAPNRIVVKDLTDPSAYTPVNGEINYIPATGELVYSQNVLNKIAQFGVDDTVKVEYEKKGFFKGEPNPITYFSCTDLNTGKAYTMNDQNLQFEFGVNTRVTINSLAKDIYTDKMYADLKSFISFVKGATVTDSAYLTEEYKKNYPTASDTQIQEMVEKHLTNEKQMLESTLHSRFKNMIELTQRFSSNSSLHETDAGVRINRLNYIADRLDQDKDAYKELLSDNEDVDYMQVIMELSSAQSVYQASLKTGASIMKLSLVDFI